MNGRRGAVWLACFVQALVQGVMVAWALSPAPAWAATRALLVGVSEYPNLPPKFTLRGPRNDVQRLRSVLLRRGLEPTAIQVLADGVPDAGAPTRAAILAALEAEAARARPGDLFMLFMAGHGSQQPADRLTAQGRDEPDALHEIFLPTDVGRWDGQAGTVTNAIADHELRSVLDRISASGAFVWAVFDACHSATLVRSGLPVAQGATSAASASAGEAEEEEEEAPAYRQISPLDLGVPAAALARSRPVPARAGLAAATARRGVATGTPAAKAVYFYASQTSERTPELRLPRRHPLRRHFGAFSYVLSGLLEDATPITYRQLAQALLADYAAQGLGFATPLVAGNGLDEPVLGGAAPPVRQWPARPGQPWQVPAGQLAGVEEGALLALMPDARAATAATLGYLRVERAELLTAQALPIEHAGKPAPNVSSDVAITVRLVEGAAVSGVGVSPLRVALDDSACRAGCAGLEGWAATVVNLPAGLEVAASAQKADLLLQPGAGRVGFVLREQGRVAARAAVPVAQEAALWAREVGAALQRVFAQRRARALVAQLARQGQPLGLDVDVVRRHPQRGVLPLTPGAGLPRWPKGEALEVRIENTDVVSRDVTLLRADTDFGLQRVFPDARGGSNRLEPAAVLMLTLERGQRAAGVEQLLLLSAPAAAQAERTDFSHLAQAGLDAPMARGGPQAGAAKEMPVPQAGRIGAWVMSLELPP